MIPVLDAREVWVVVRPIEVSDGEKRQNWAIAGS